MLVLVLGCAREPQRPATPQRIVSLAVGTDEIVLSLVPPERVAAVSPYAGDPIKSFVADKAKGLPTVRRDDTDAILALKPDLVVLSTRASKETETLLSRAGVPVVRVPTPRSLEDIRKSVREVAGAVGAPEKGDELLAGMDQQLLELERRPSRSRRALFYAPGGWTAGSETSLHWVLRYAGFQNAAAELEGHVQVQIEWVLATDPDVILVPEGYREYEGWREKLLADPRLATLRAVREKRVLGVPARCLSVLSHFLADAAAELRGLVGEKK